MTNAELNTALYQKMFAEQEAFRNKLLAMTPQEILDHAYEYTSREDILLAMENNDLSNRQAKSALEVRDASGRRFYQVGRLGDGSYARRLGRLAKPCKRSCPDRLPRLP